jgi:hypothetical protein
MWLATDEMMGGVLGMRSCSKKFSGANLSDIGMSSGVGARGYLLSCAYETEQFLAVNALANFIYV